MRIKGRIRDITPKDVGRTETFGELAFSHNLIQYIGGEADTNKNTTRRILLLLESMAIGDAEAYRRVVLSVLQRYLEGDISFVTSSGRYKVPRFLLNDIVRYWRIMCVDYATKSRERANEGWAIRNVKLRMSRKLIFAAGLLMCFSCQLQNLPTRKNLFDQLEFRPLLSHLEQYIAMPPLAIVAEGLLRYGKDETARELVGAYDEFLSILDDTEAREKLEKLRQEENKTDTLFKKVKVMSDRFDNALMQFFFDDNTELGQLTRTYGVF